MAHSLAGSSGQISSPLEEEYFKENTGGFHCKLSSDTIPLMESFLVAFKEIRSGIIPFLTDLDESLNQLSASMPHDEFIQKKSALLQAIVEQYLKENRQAMDHLIAQSERFFSDVLEKYAFDLEQSEQKNKDFNEHLAQCKQQLADKDREIFTQQNTVQTLLQQLQKYNEEIERVKKLLSDKEQEYIKLSVKYNIICSQKDALKKKIESFIANDSMFRFGGSYKDFLSDVVKNDLAG